MKLLTLTSPHMRGQDVKDAQWLLSGHNRYNKKWYHGKIDGEFGLETAKAARQAKFDLGYPKDAVQSNFGPLLYAYLLPLVREKAKRRPPQYVLREKYRARQANKANTVKAKALAIAWTEARKGITESPRYSNNQKYGIWYGVNRVPWCAIFVTYCFVNAGSKVFRKGAVTAWSKWPYYEGAAHRNGFSLTRNPEPGDICVYFHHDGHIGIFRRWIDRSRGIFQAIEGNTAAHNGSQDNGGAVLIQTRTVGDYMNVQFVSYGAKQ